jgi:hypothetical protein
MTDMLKMTDENMAEAEATRLFKAYLAELEQHRALLAKRHIKGDAYVESLFEKVTGFIGASATAAQEQAEALAANTERAAAVDEGRALIKQAREKVSLIIDQSDDTEAERTRAETLRYDFGLRGPRWRIDLNAHIDELLELVHVGVHKHKALFEETGEDAAFFAAPQAAKAKIEQATRSHQKERNEGILATRWANTLRDEAESLMDMALRIVNTHASGTDLHANLLNIQRERG